MKLDFVAQLVEQLTLNQWVEGSSPSEVTFNHSSIERSLLHLARGFFFFPEPSDDRVVGRTGRVARRQDTQ